MTILNRNICKSNFSSTLGLIYEVWMPAVAVDWCRNNYIDGWVLTWSLPTPSLILIAFLSIKGIWFSLISSALTVCFLVKERNVRLLKQTIHLLYTGSSSSRQRHQRGRGRLSETIVSLCPGLHLIFSIPVALTGHPETDMLANEE